MESAVFAYLGAWNLSSPVEIAKTPTSHIYRVRSPEGPAVLKVLSPIGIADEQGGALALEYFHGEGAVNVLRFDEGAQLLEYIEGESLATLVHDGRDADAARIAAKLLNKLHQKRSGPFPEGLWSLERWFQSLFLRSEQSGCPESFRQAASVAKDLLSSPQRISVLHGDIHHENILLSPARGWLSIDPKGLLGEVTFDAVNLFYNPVGTDIRRDRRRIEHMTRILSEQMGIECKRILRFAFAYGFLSASWNLEDQRDPTSTLEIANKIKMLF